MVGVVPAVAEDEAEVVVGLRQCSGDSQVSESQLSSGSFLPRSRGSVCMKMLSGLRESAR